MKITFDQILTQLAEKKPFVFMRYGDGEIRAILQPGSGQNCDGHEYFPEMGVALDDVLQHQNENQTFYMGLQSLGKRLYPEFINRYPNIQWSDADILHCASIAGRIGDLVNALVPSTTLLIGPAHLDHAVGKDWIGRHHAWMAHIKTPTKNAWQSYEDLYERIKDFLIDIPLQTILFSCGMMAEPLIAQLHRRFPEVTMIDTGSVWDPYAGVISRVYHQEIIDTTKFPNPQDPRGIL